MFKRIAAVTLAVLAQTASAASWEETFLVLQTSSGALIQLEYSSEGEDEQLGIRQYAKYSSEAKAKPTRCSYKDGDSPRKLTCTSIEGKPAHWVLEERSAPARNSTFLARHIYKRFVADRLPSSVGRGDSGEHRLKKADLVRAYGKADTQAAHRGCR